MPTHNELYKNVESATKKWPKVPLARRQLIARYLAKNAPTKYTFLGLGIPIVRQSFKSLNVQDYSDSEQLKTFHMWWMKNTTFEEALLSLYWLETLSVDKLIKFFPKIIKWSNKIDNWAHADGYCSILAKIYEARPDLLKPIYSQWRSHKSPWLRRLSLVGIVYYARLRDQHPDYKTLMVAVEKLIHDDHYYVQKAVGWTVRETYNIYPEQTLKFIFSYSKKFAPAAWYAVTEKLPKKHKQQALGLRKI